MARIAWPLDPLGGRREAIAAAAEQVRASPGDWSVENIEHPVVRAEAERWSYEVNLLLAERARNQRAPGDAMEVALPGQLSVSQLVELGDDPGALAARLRRPMPVRPDPQSRRGTAFHRWLEQRFGSQQLLDLDELPGAGDEGAADDAALAELQAAFLRGAWADRVPTAVEVGFATTVGGVVIRGRMDAVFANDDGTFDVIDWKTGRRPSGRHAQVVAVQLAAYRLAWAELAGVPVDDVRAGFYYVRDDVTVRPADLHGRRWAGTADRRPAVHRRRSALGRPRLGRAAPSTTSGRRAAQGNLGCCVRAAALVAAAVPVGPRRRQ